MIRLAGIVLVFLMATSSAAADEVPAELVGKWRFIRASGIEVPASCAGLAYEFHADGTLTGWSGEFHYRARMRIGRTGQGYIVHLKLLDHTDGANCQGRPASYVVSRFVTAFNLELHDGLLYEFYWRPGDPYVVYEKVDELPNYALERSNEE